MQRKMLLYTAVCLLLINNHRVYAINSDADLLTLNLIQWVRVNGGYVNDKIAFRNTKAGDVNSPRGVFALQDIDEGETLAVIPWDLIIKSPERAAGEFKGRLSDDDCGVMKATLNAMTASEDDMTPYAKYLLSQPQNYTVGFWTRSGQELFVEMTGGTWETDNILPPTDIDDPLIDFEEMCGGNVSDALAVQAAMLVKARSDYEYMVPLYDMFNHDNGNYNVQHKYNPYTSPLHETGYGVVTQRKVHADEELYNSYNRCNICEGWFDWFGTPEVYMHYGFVENYPQRWLFDLARVKVDLLPAQDGTVDVKFLVPPSEKGIEMLSRELLRLNEFAKTYRHKSHEDMSMRSMEWYSMWEYYDSLHAALTYVTETKESLVDDVWALGSDWWVQEGVNEGEHTVRNEYREEF